MKILQLTKKFPYPPKDGESLAILSMAKGYQQCGHQVTLLALNTKKHYVATATIDRDGFSYYHHIHDIYIDTSLQPLAAFFNLFSDRPYNTQRFYSNEYAQQLTRLLADERYDVIQLETLYMLEYIDIIRRYSKAKIVYRSHNKEDEIWENLAEQESNFLKKKYFQLCARRLSTFEKQNVDKVDTIAVISESDLNKHQQLYQHIKQVSILPGMDIQPPVMSVLPKSIKVGYIGSLDWKPNIEGLKWFFTEIWDNESSLTNQLHIEFHLAGRNASHQDKDYFEGQTVFHGEVEDASMFLDLLDIIIVPLKSGSGIRIKILEAMSKGKIVIATKKGLEGIPYTHGENAFLFSDAQDFAQNIKRIFEQKEEWTNIGLRAQALIKEHFSHQANAHKLIDFIS